MKVDCDGIDYHCKVSTPQSQISFGIHRYHIKGNTDGQPQTDFGALSAYAVPYIVIPGRFASRYPNELPGNNIAAVIWYVEVFT